MEMRIFLYFRLGYKTGERDILRKEERYKMALKPKWSQGHLFYDVFTCSVF